MITSEPKIILRIGFVMDAVADRLSLNPGDIGFIKHNADIGTSTRCPALT